MVVGERYRVGLIACGKEKRDAPSPAGELYTGTLFRKARTYVERTCNAWGILSAKHGLLLPETVVEPYDVHMPTNHAERRRWVQRVAYDLVTTWCTSAIVEGAPDMHGLPTQGWDRSRAPLFVLLAGADYRIAFEGPIGEAIGPDVDTLVPMRGLEIGEQLQWLTRENANLSRKAA